MKPLKITLAVIVVAAIGAGIFFWIQSIKEPETVKAPKNQFTAKIEQEIEQLKAKSAMSFCKEFYKKIELQINSFHKQKKFSTSQFENDQYKENLEKTLYSVYAEKFIKQAIYVFSKPDWQDNDLRFIQSEKSELIGKRDMHGNKFLVAGSPVYNDFMTIQTALKKYNEIVSFIWFCKNLSCPGSNLSDRFPIADVQSKIQRAANLQQKHLENRYVNNCTRLHDGLKEIPQSLFNKHVLYLDNKIDYWSNMWCNFNSHKDYSQNLNTPLRNEINDLGNSTFYTGVNVDNEYDRLLNKWRKDNQNAYNATYPCN